MIMIIRIESKGFKVNLRVLDAAEEGEYGDCREKKEDQNGSLWG
jgi:hypothetical protein